MTEALRTYLLSVTAAALLLAVVQAVLPAGAVRRAASLCGSLLVLLTVLSPLARLEAEDLAKALSKVRLQTEFSRTGIEVQNRQLMGEIIIDRCEEYILDKASELGLTLEVCVTLSEDSSWPYPTAVTLVGEATNAQRQQLTCWIAENLGVPAAQQEWK